MSDDVSQEEDIGMVPQSPVMIHKQYLKDLSFENPNAPGILMNVQGRPEMNMDISIDVEKLEHDEFEHFFEVSLTITANGVREDQTMFLIEAVYGAAVSINPSLDEKKHHPILFVEVPQMIFPFLRHILAHATLSGGFMPLQLTPVDFRTMYLKRFGKKDKE